MASFSDQIDRLSRYTKAIRSTAAQTAIGSGKSQHSTQGVAGPFTRAVLNTYLGDLIRDVDPSELGLFTLLTPQPTHARDRDARGGAPPPEVARVEFAGATPLRKAPSRRDDALKPKEIEPEVYAEAALKYIDRYQPIRPMPRAHSQVVAILERLGAVRENIQNLNDSLKQAQTAENVPLQSLAQEEEKRVESLQSRLSNLKRRKQAALDQQKGPAGKHKPTLVEAKGKSKPELPPSSPHEDKFWNTPAAAARTLRFTENLMDEEVDLGDVTTTSFMSPLPAPPSMRPRSLLSPDQDVDDEPEEYADSDSILDDLDSSPVAPVSQGSLVEDSMEDEEHDSSDDEGDQTVVLEKPVPLKPQSPPVPSGDLDQPAPETPGTKQGKVRINSEVERIVARIWVTAGDIIMPGNPFDVSGTARTSSKPPRAKETIAHLQSLATLPPPLSSPSTSSASSASVAMPAPPTSQQIMTAYLLLSLLSSPTQFSLPLGKVKDLLGSKAQGGGGQGTTRIIYGCVAKRLVKIERGGGEQIVKFDI